MTGAVTSPGHGWSGGVLTRESGAPFIWYDAAAGDSGLDRDGGLAGLGRVYAVIRAGAGGCSSSAVVSARFAGASVPGRGSQGHSGF